jgi:cytoskeleton protein RodZ
MDPGVGETLRDARLGQDIELVEVERVTKIRARFLRAIEDEHWDVLPGRAYARGFLRTYAEFLDLDPDPLVKMLDRALEPAAEEAPPEPVVQHGTMPRGLIDRLSPRLVAALGGGALIVLLVVLGLTAGNDDDRAVPSPLPAEEEPEEPPDPEPEPEPEQASVNLTAVGTVWVCMVDGRGEALVDGETLTAGEERGPFEARRLLMTFGNGEIELTADDELFEVPAAAEPLGYEVTSDGIQELDTAERPTCA